MYTVIPVFPEKRNGTQRERLFNMDEAGDLLVLISYLRMNYGEPMKRKLNKSLLILTVPNN